MRVMLDTTHSGLPGALSMIKALKAGDIVGGYDTGTPGIEWAPGDWSQVPPQLSRVAIDQGFTGSPNMGATVRDCERGAWTLVDAVKRDGWNVQRPTLYLGYPDTMMQAHDAGWRGDVWLALSAAAQPSKPPAAPPGITVVAQQWNYQNPEYDLSVVFDPYWPKARPLVATPTPPPGQWLDAQQWSWQQVIVIGRGLNNQLYCFAYDTQTGKWVSQPVPV